MRIMRKRSLTQAMGAGHALDLPDAAVRLFQPPDAPILIATIAAPSLKMPTFIGSRGFNLKAEPPPVADRSDGATQATFKISAIDILG
jgi:hypothetical protein